MSTLPFSVRSFLRSHQALLVHFNTPMSVKHPTGFPDDLRNAKTLQGEELSFSTIQAGDSGPWQAGAPGYGNAAGCVGIVVDVADSGAVVKVRAGDAGTGPSGSLGEPPDPQTCLESIELRKSINEWVVKDYKFVGIFLFPAPITVYVKGKDVGERGSDIDEIFREFPEDRVFSTIGGSFVEFNRSYRTISVVTYDEIIPI